MSDLRAYMIGPQGENLDLFRQLVLQVLDDQLHRRTAYHPEDRSSLPSGAADARHRQEFSDRLRSLLRQLLSEARDSVPFFSPRYMGHMNADLLLPGLVGYFAFMLGNPNNVDGDSAPITARLEREVVAMLSGMVGFRSGPDDMTQPGGYLCSGGTVANVYALWLARSCRSWPLALRIAVEHAKGAPSHTAAIAREVIVPGSGGNAIRLGDASARDLWNIPSRGAYRLKSALETMLQRAGGEGLDTYAGRQRAIDQLVDPWALSALGELGFSREAAAVFPAEREIFERPPLVLMAANSHYSFLKSLDLLGMGRGSGGGRAEISVANDFTLDPAALRSRLARALKGRERVLAVVSTVGTTEEGAIDDLPAIKAVCQDFEDRGLASWLHVDACYGGYLGTLVRADEGGPAQSGEQVVSWLRELAAASGFSAGAADNDISRGNERPGDEDNEGSGWLNWNAFASRIAAMGEADSISIDPHKLGYVPYPAGAVLLRHQADAGAICYDAPYLWSQPPASPAHPSGRHTLEGSRPGATAAACWLAHRAVPLSQQGHGKIVAASILAARRLYGALEKLQASHPIAIAFINRPHANVFCYLPYHQDSRDLKEVAAVCEIVAARLCAGNDPDFVVSRTTTRITATPGWMVDRFGRTHGLRFLKVLDRDAGADLPVLRSVVMGPSGWGAATQTASGEARDLFDLFSEHLAQLTERVYLEYRQNATPHERFSL